MIEQYYTTRHDKYSCRDQYDDHRNGENDFES